METRKRLQLQISERRLLVLLGDLAAITVAVLIALRVWALVADESFDVDFLAPQLYWLPVLMALWLLLAWINDFYNLRLMSDRTASFMRLVQVTLQLLVVYLIIFFLSPRDALPRLFILYYGLASFLLISLWRAWRPFLVGWTGFRRRVLLVGTDWAAQTMIETLQGVAPGVYELVGVIGPQALVGKQFEAVPVLGTGLEMAVIAERERVSEVILTTSRTLDADVFQGVMGCHERGITITPMPLLYEQLTGRVPVEHVGQHWEVVLPIEHNSIFNPYPAFSRLLDVLFALIGLILFALISPFIALIIRLDSPGPIFYKQDRIGKAGREFAVYKLRSMVQDAEKDSGPLWSAKGDPRITSMGRILRKSRLDEVPQLLNVLRGEMSMVGPRPERAAFVDMLTEDIPFYRTRLAVKPGVTGWAQVQYKYGSTTHDALIKLQYDLYYIRHQSIALDLLILARTVRKVLAFEGS